MQLYQITIPDWTGDVSTFTKPSGWVLSKVDGDTALQVEHGLTAKPLAMSVVRLPTGYVPGGGGTAGDMRPPDSSNSLQILDDDTVKYRAMDGFSGSMILNLMM